MMTNETLQDRKNIETVADEANGDAANAAAARDSRVGWGTLIKYLLFGIVAMFLLLVLLDKVVMPWYVKLGAVETVPNVVGSRFEDAQRRLSKLGFDVKKGEPRFDDRYPAGTVVMQLPYGGTQTKQGRRIYLTVSRGTEMIPMLDLVGMPLREARINLMRSGFEIGEMTYDHNDTMMKDLIFGQSIPAKVLARPGSVVDVMISRGPSTRFTMMPNLLGLDIDQARTRLENAGMVMGVIRYKADPTYAKNTIVEQAISPYSQVAQGAAVDVTVSGDPDPDDTTLPSDEDAGDEPTVKNIAPPSR
jgi:serine/threonine-protein kinase